LEEKIKIFHHGVHGVHGEEHFEAKIKVKNLYHGDAEGTGKSFLRRRSKSKI